jgi:SCO1/SenC
VLTSQDGAVVKLANFRGKVVAVPFIFTRCTYTCPVLTPMMCFVQDRLGATGVPRGRGWEMNAIAANGNFRIRSALCRWA